MSVKNEHTTTGQQNNYSNVYNYYGNKKILKHLGTIPTFPEYFIGRDKEVEVVHQRLTTQQNILLLVNGRGGIGKTTLASKYYYQYQDYYQHLVWVFSGTSIVEALLTLAFPLGVEFPPQSEPEQKLNILLQTLLELHKPCLLIIDNANELKDIQTYHNRLLACTNFHILLTTRVNKEIPNTTFYKVKPLEPKAALQLFKKHYPDHTTTEDDLFFQIYEAVNRNTLVVELLAKNLVNFNDDLEQNYPLSKLVQEINHNLLQLSKSDKVQTFYQTKDGKPRTEKPENIIAAMYDLSHLNDMEKYLLANLSVLPAESLPYHRLKTLLQQDNLNKHLKGLYEKGWLEYDKNAKSFRMSPVIQEVVRQKNRNLYQDCEPLINEFIEKLAYELGVGHLKNISYKEGAILVRYASYLVEVMTTFTSSISMLYERIGRYFQTTGNIIRALESFEKNTQLSKKRLESNPHNIDFKNGLAISYSKLGSTHSSLGNLTKALEFFEKDALLSKELYEAYPNNVGFKNGLAISYSKLGSTHSSLGNLTKALEFFEKDALLSKELYEAYSNNVDFKNCLAIAYCFLGITYQSLGNLEKALGNYKLYNELQEELHKDFPSNVKMKNDLAISYEKLGETHSSLGNLTKALEFFEIRSTLGKELYEAYPNNVDFKNGLAISYSKLGSTHSSLGNLTKALEFFEIGTTLFEELYEAYPNNVDFKNGLAISYSKLGSTHSSLGNLTKALEFFEIGTTLFEELYEAYPNNVGFKNGLAISYSKLGETHSSLGNLTKALEFFEQFTQLMKELYDSYPNNVGFKNGLAISYIKLGWFYAEKSIDVPKAKTNYTLSQQLLSELVAAFPAYVKFKSDLDWVEAALNRLL